MFGERRAKRFGATDSVYAGFEITNSRASAGWGNWEMVARGHFCYPPKAYAQGTGDGSSWQCASLACGRRWVAEGYRMVGSYPNGSTPERGVLTGPKRWVRGAGNDARQNEVNLYDWRESGDVIAELLKKILERL